MNNKHGNLLLVSRPIDFLFAIEICNTYKSENFTILLFPNSNIQEENAIVFLKRFSKESILNASFIKFRSCVNNDTISLFIFKFYLILKFGNKKFNLISTSGGPKGRLLLKHLSFNEIIITDEGSSSLKRFPEILERDRVFAPPKGNSYRYRYFLLGILHLNWNYEFKLWTIYNELDNLDERIFVTNFEKVRAMIKELNIPIHEEEIVVLGTYPRSIGMEENIYKDLLHKTFAEYEGYNIYLKPHKKYTNTFDFQELKSHLPIEYYFIENGSLPKYLLSFNSTSNKLMQNLFPQVIVQNIQNDVDDQSFKI